MAITQEQVKAIRQELNSMKPDVTTMGNQGLTVKQTIIALAPTLERMKKRGFELAEIVSRLHDKGIDVDPVLIFIPLCRFSWRVRFVC